MTEDTGILSRIQELVDEEHRLLATAEGDEATRERLHAIETQLDQCWDLLRQRRGKRHAGKDPDEARVRDAPTVESYQQ
jgi:hypothetical protein